MFSALAVGGIFIDGCGTGGLRLADGDVGPAADEEDGSEQGGGEDGKGSDPGYEVETVRGGRGEYDCAIFGDEGIEDFLVGAASGNAGAEFMEFGGGAGAADVIAFAEDLRATAGAHEAVVEVGVARACVCCADGEADGDGEQGGLDAFDPDGEAFGGCHLVAAFQRGLAGDGAGGGNADGGGCGTDAGNEGEERSEDEDCEAGPDLTD